MKVRVTSGERPTSEVCSDAVADAALTNEIRPALQAVRQRTHLGFSLNVEREGPEVIIRRRGAAAASI